MDQDPPRVADETPLANPNQFPILYQDVRLKDKRRVEFSKPPYTKAQIQKDKPEGILGP